MNVGNYLHQIKDVKLETSAATPQDIGPRDVNGHVMFCVATALVTDATAGYGPGCLLIDTANKRLYINVGSAASCDFDYFSTLT